MVDTICRDFEIDIAVFRAADARLVAYLDSERLRVAQSLTADVAAALAAEAGEADRAAVLAFLRDRLAGVDVPFDVRAFAETVWADHLTALRQQYGPDSAEWTAGVRTLDDMLWSIVAKERAAQKARLTKMIPTLIGALRQGCVARAVAPERARAFFDALYALHMAAIKPKAAATAHRAAAAPDQAAGGEMRRRRPPHPRPQRPSRGYQRPRRRTAASSEGSSACAAATHPRPCRALDGAVPPDAPAVAPIPAANVHDYVSEMPVGTWLAFDDDGGAVNARLSWVSPLRTKYLFTSRTRSRAFVYTPEELAWALGAGQAAVVVEPVPLFDRAVSAALDTLAARQSATRSPLAA